MSSYVKPEEVYPMSTTLFIYLMQHSTTSVPAQGGFLFDAKREDRAVKEIAPGVSMNWMQSAGIELKSSQVVHGYTVTWTANQAGKQVSITPACTCKDWLESGGWTEKRLCKHLLALAMKTNIPASMENLEPEAFVPHTDPAPAAPAAKPSKKAKQQSFSEQISEAIGAAIADIAAQTKAILDEGLVPLLVGPTGCGKTSAQSLSCRLVEHAGSDAYTDSDLVGVMMPSGLRLPGPVAQALGHAREMGEPVLLFLDEFTRYHLRAQESLMRLLLPIGADVAASLGIDHNGAIRATSAPFWGDEWAPADQVHIALACNPWGTPLDPALVRRTVPVQVQFAAPVMKLFEKRLQSAIAISWKGTVDGTLPLPLEYGELARAESPDDDRILARYKARLTVLDLAAGQAFDALMKSAGV
jgi:hypothetical protein